MGRRLYTMKLEKFLLGAAIIIVSVSAYAGNLAREFNIYVPPQTEYAERISMVVVTAVVGDGRPTEVNIIDRYLSDVDPDSDDTVRNIILSEGQSYVLYLKEGSVNDSYGGTLDGDYFRINGSHRIQVAIMTASNWEYDYLPPYWHSDGTVDFYVFVPYSSHVSDWRLNVMSYADGANVLVEDITEVRKTDSGYSSVVPVGTGEVRWSGVLNRGEDLLAVKGQNVLNYTHSGRTYHVHADDSVTVMVGSLGQSNSGRDGGCYVMNVNGRNTGREFYMYLPDNYNNEKEIKINTYSESATFNLSCWNGTQWETLLSNVALDAWDHYDYFGDNSIGYTQELFKLEASAPVAAFTGTWLESGSLSTSDDASYISSEYGYGAGHYYMVFIPPPSWGGDEERLSHVIITTIDEDARVDIIDTDHGGSIINESVTLNTNDVYDLQVDRDTWYALADGNAAPYVKIYSPKEIRVLTTNWNDNWLTYAAGIVVPQYSELYYENMPYERWVFLGLPLETVSNNPDDIFGPYFGGPEWSDETNNVQNTRWRFSRWDITWNTYVRWGEPDYDGGWHGDPPDPQPGFGYWFYNRYASAIDFCITGFVVDTTEAYYIPVNPPQGDDHPGLNQLANPFPMVIDWKDAEVEVTTSSGTVEKSLLEANSEGLISQWAHRWNGYEYIPYNATNGGDFLIWDGFWVEQLTDSIGSSSSTVTYDVTQHSNWDYSTIFHNPSVALGEGETDQFRIDYNAEYLPFLYIMTYVDDLNHPSGWVRLYAVEGASAVTTQGFSITLAEKTDDHYLFNVTESTNTSPLYGVQFYCYVDKTAPLTGTTYEADRIGAVGQSAVALRLKVPPVNVDLAKSAPDVKDNPFSKTMDTESGDWFASLKISNSDNTVRDSYNGFGHKMGAYSTYDVNDARNITPYLYSFVDIYFPHNNPDDMVNYWKSNPIKACYDIRPGTDTTVWDFTVSSYNFSNQVCTITWDLSNVHDDVSLSLIDMETQTVTDMISTGSLSVTTPSGSGFQTKSFQIIAIRADLSTTGIQGPVETIPSAFVLEQNYPNPFNPTTTIRFQVPHEEYVMLAVYSLQGKRVKTLWSGNKTAGDYRIQWNGTDNAGQPVASGVYLTKLSTPTMTLTNKMLLLK